MIDDLTIMSFIINICRFIDSLLLVIYSFFIKGQDLLEHNNLELLPNTVPLIQEFMNGTNFLDKKFINQHPISEDFSMHEKLEQNPDQIPIKIMIEVKPKVIYRNDQVFYEMKISINNEGKVYKIHRSILDFISLEKTLLKDVKLKSFIFPKSFEEIIKFSDSFSSLDSVYSLNQSQTLIIDCLNQYLNRLICHLELLNIHLVLFLEIPEPFRKLILQKNNKLIQNLIESKRNRPNLSNEFAKPLNGISFDILEIKILEDNEDSVLLELNLLELPLKKWVITKKKIAIHDFLTKFRSNSIEKPKKKSESSVLQNSFLKSLDKIKTPFIKSFGIYSSFKINEDLQIELRKICNENKENFFDRNFLEFLGIEPNIENMIKICLSDQEKLMKGLKIGIIETLMIFNKNKGKESTYYNILIESVEKTDQKTVFFKNIYKKYKNFKELNGILIKKFGEKTKGLPNLPNKNSIFGKKNKSYVLKEELEFYLKDLIEFPYIGESMAFRRFLNVCFLKGSFIEEPFFERQIQGLSES